MANIFFIIAHICAVLLGVVGLIITIYLVPESSGLSISPEALALGWIIWASQTIMMIILGLISLIINGKNVKLINE